MCGVNGFNFKDEDLIKKMNYKIRHRGPDDEGFYIDDHISLGHRRLSIIDLSEHGRQPIFNETKELVVIFNGEIYNYQELRQELAGRHDFYTNTDTEVIVHLYEELGYKCLDRLNGIFVFAIWDKRNQELFIARDRLGVKPLYYFYQAGRFIFSSEIKAILEHPAVRREVNLESFNHYFNLGYVPQPLTMFKGINKLPSASYLLLKGGQLDIKKYWQVADFSNLGSKGEIKEKINWLVNDSVKHQLISDRPVGIFLSGGIDSNVVLGVASKYSSTKIKTYTVGFEEKHGDKFNADFKLAAETARYYQTDHHQLVVTEQDIANNLESAVYHIDGAINNSAQISVYLLSRLAKQEVAVELSGAGGDELFGGYPRYCLNMIIDQWQRLPVALRSGPLQTVLGRVFGNNLLEKLDSQDLDRYKQFMFRREKDIDLAIKPGVRQPRLTDKFYQDSFFGADYLSLKPALNGDFTKYFSLLDLQSWLVDYGLSSEDKITMAFGLEERVPLLDHRLVELSVRIPTKFKVGIKKTKVIFREAMKDYIAPHLLHEPKKGFTNPTSEWLRTGLYDFAKQVLSPGYCPATEEFFNFSEIDRIFSDHVERKKYNLNLIWGLIIWQIWYKQFIDY